ncbi:DUF4373 domain-containing protein [Crassaminicella thermophila]|uniref:DUF4373 domain-containing protein n=1 Tax=Crassaminicella thermophila TaxID=2599308 RepID=UPI00143CD3C7|nr:DUF4373 domain-containing protein [Crassaminicella thermophila]
MAKDAYYFSHDSNARHDPKILAMRSVYGSEGYGWYWILIETFREQENYKLKITKHVYNALAMQMQCNAEQAQCYVNDCINEFELFETDGDFIWSNSLLKRMQNKEEKSEKARKAAQARWNKNKGNQGLEVNKESECNAGAMQTQCESNTLKESKGKESKRNKKDINNIPVKLKFDVDSTQYRLANYLKNYILKNNPKAKVPGLKDMDKWSVHIDRLIRLDGRTEDEIKKVIQWCQKDSFWMTNILSTKKLREKFDTLFLQMNNERTKKGYGRGKQFETNTEKIMDSMDSIQRFLEMEEEDG